ncbi:hypothetical protein GCM10011492_23620 [Flexivirga endophytica]|uniref:DUF475 domain-containing protein n=1 Tax=Flexivirga endophytica TaxID=1849103 RepID=A0A916WV02_9MICO|nr:DUF475 domain-containing protein [Flexivirga endophytica]GGB32227.1 hypothetical protein GCM10011492_23620 [Flexivirga endophytica]GHB53143.1 hypothetical protein GCM10008112_22900 [Flexivirga endophytica]
MQALKHFRIDFVITAAVLVVAFLYDSWAGVGLTAILIVVEIVFSFDNAAVNAKYLDRLNHFWQTMFLTVGVIVAVFGMRLVFPFVIVCLSGSISPWSALNLALEKGDPHTPGTYGYILTEAHPAIAAFGGMFLLLLFLDFMFDEDREISWLTWIEKPLKKLGKLDVLSVIIAGIFLLVASETLVHETHVHTAVQMRSIVLFSGLLGIILYLAVSGLSTMMEEREAAKDHEFEEADAHSSTGQKVLLAGKAAFSMFIFLEVLDATFSFDGVIGAFAITPDPIIIMLGLGVGAMYVRSMTIFLVRNGTLAEYRFLENGAHWAIGALAVMLVISIRYDLGEFVIGGVGIAFILAAWASSILANKRDAVAEGATDSTEQGANV